MPITSKERRARLRNEVARRMLESLYDGPFVAITKLGATQKM